MKCDLCDKKATVYLTQIVEGKMKKVNLCQDCAKEQGVTDPTGFALADLLFGLGKQETVSTSKRSRRTVECPSCGYTQDQLKKTGRLGCPQCYEAFGDGLASLINAMHKGNEHKGKVPSGMIERRVRAAKLKDLRQQLKKSIEQERYESAAALRDEIQQLENEWKENDKSKAKGRDKPKKQGNSTASSSSRSSNG